ncbi:MAG TPA: hypothetical protein VGL11_15055 [Candidatus Binatia bacterium]
MADVKEVEVELGYFNLERAKGKNNFIIPTVVLNYGFMPRVEVVAEFAVEEPSHGRTRLIDAGLSLKAIVREGVLQEKSGPSLAIEAGPLFPSTVGAEKRFGFRGAGILSDRLASLTYHLNLGGGIDREKNNSFFDWGVIVEFPITAQFRLVTEVNGENAHRKPSDSSGLVGVIWESPFHNTYFDAGIRKGISRGAPDWLFTSGLTFAFSLSSSATK